jgi:hypothetical protein
MSVGAGDAAYKCTAIAINHSTLLPQPLFEVLALDDPEDQHNSVSVHDLIHDAIVADTHSKERILGSLDGFDKLARWPWIPGKGIDGSFEAPAFRSGGSFERTHSRASELNAKGHRSASDS